MEPSSAPPAPHQGRIWTLHIPNYRPPLADTTTTKIQGQTTTLDEKENTPNIVTQGNFNSLTYQEEDDDSTLLEREQEKYFEKSFSLDPREWKREEAERERLEMLKRTEDNQNSEIQAFKDRAIEIVASHSQYSTRNWRSTSYNLITSLHASKPRKELLAALTAYNTDASANNKRNIYAILDSLTAADFPQTAACRKLRNWRN